MNTTTNEHRRTQMRTAWNGTFPWREPVQRAVVQSKAKQHWSSGCGIRVHLCPSVVPKPGNPGLRPSVLDSQRCPGVSTAKAGTGYGGSPVLRQCWSVGLPLDLRWTSVGPPPGFRQHHGVSTESEGGFDSIGVAAIQGKPHFRATSIPSGDFATLVVLKRSGLWTLDFGHWAFGPLPASAASQPSTIVGPQTC